MSERLYPGDFIAGECKHVDKVDKVN